MNVKDFNWHNIGSNIAAIIFFVQSIYPDVTIEKIIAMTANGTIWIPALKLAVVYFLHKYQGPVVRPLQGV